METERHEAPNGDGWTLDVRRHFDPERFRSELRPVLFIPGYCMNTTPLTFHPGGLSMIEYLTREGLEVWTANLRGQGDSHSRGGRRNVGFAELSLTDLPTAISYVLLRTKTVSKHLDLIGCSLGGTYVYAYLAHHAHDHPIASVVGLGAPIRWDHTHPALRFIFASPRIAGWIPVRGTRRLARTVLPVAERFPSLLSIYMNTEMIDLSAIDELVMTVEDPIRRLNREIAEWIRSGDLEVRGLNISRTLARIDRPVLCIVANSDGIVPSDSARPVLELVGSDDTELLEVGDEANRFAHADLYINREAERRVFRPLAEWLLARQ